MARDKNSDTELTTVQGQTEPPSTKSLKEGSPISSTSRGTLEQKHSTENASTSRSAEMLASQPPETRPIYRKKYESGKIRFMKGREQLREANFLKISSDNDEDKESILKHAAEDIVSKLPNLLEKNLLLSVTDSMDQLDDDTRTDFKQGLAKVLPGTCVVTGGTYNGITQLVGDVVEEFNSLKPLKDECPAIGIITNWDCIKNADLLKPWELTRGAFGIDSNAQLFSIDNNGKRWALNPAVLTGDDDCDSSSPRPAKDDLVLIDSKFESVKSSKGLLRKGDIRGRIGIISWDDGTELEINVRGVTSWYNCEAVTLLLRKNCLGKLKQHFETYKPADDRDELVKASQNSDVNTLYAIILKAYEDFMDLRGPSYGVNQDSNFFVVNANGYRTTFYLDEITDDSGTNDINGTANTIPHEFSPGDLVKVLSTDVYDDDQKTKIGKIGTIVRVDKDKRVVVHVDQTYCFCRPGDVSLVNRGNFGPLKEHIELHKQIDESDELLQAVADGDVENVDVIIRKAYMDVQSFCEYEIPQASDESADNTNPERFLDPRHDMFVFVEDTTLNKFGGEIEFRAELETRISSEMFRHRLDVVTINESVQEVPIVNLVVNGDLNTLKTVTRAMDNGTPSLILKGSKGVTDVISYAVENTIADIRERQDIVGVDSKNEVITGMLENIRITYDEFATFQQIFIQQPHLLVVVNLCNEFGKLEEAILDICWTARLNGMCLSKWTFSDHARVVVLRRVVLKDDTQIKNDALSTIMCYFVIHDDGEVVERLLQMDVCMDSVLIEAVQFTEFRNKVDKDGLLNSWKLHKKLRFTPGNKDVQTVMWVTQRMATRPVKGNVDAHNKIGWWRSFEGYTDKFSILPYWCYMFFWALLLRRYDLAKILWRKVEHPIAIALLANNLCNAVKHQTDDAVLDAEMAKNMSTWHSMAVDVLRECYQNDKADRIRVEPTCASYGILKETVPYLNKTCLELAVDSSNMEFIDQQACRNMIENFWHQGNPSFRKVLTIIICPWTIEWPAGRFIYGYCRVIKSFCLAPKTKFACNMISYLMFLGLFAYVLLFDLPSTVSNKEYVLLTWVLTILLEEIRQMHQTTKIHGLKKYFLEGWNSIDIFTIGLFLIGFGARFKQFRDTFDYPRVLLAVDFVAFFFRLVHIFSVQKILGPKLIIIKQMVQDMLYFLVIMAVFLLSYAIASYSILYPNSPVNVETARQIFRKPYWHLYGELFLDEMEGLTDCTHDASLWTNGTFPRCPSETGRIVVPIMMGVYVLFANILLLNLLIAMFSYTFKNIHEQSDKVWRFHRYHMIREFVMRPPLCPPLNVFWHIYQLFQMCRSTYEKKEDPFRNPNHFWSKFINIKDREKEAVSRYVQSLKLNEAECNDSRMKTAYEQLDHLKTKVEEEETFRHQAFEALNKKIDDLEKKAERESIELRRIVLIILEKIDALSKKNNDETKPKTEEHMKASTQM